MIGKLLLQERNRVQLILTWIGAFIGFFLLLASLQFFLDIKQLISEKNDWLRPEYVVINKPVSILNSIGGSSNFSSEDLKELESNPAVKQLVPFRSNNFQVGGRILEQSFSKEAINLYTDLFFESLPSKYLDVRSDKWHWDPSSEEVPIIVPSDYLRLYNFGFSPSRDLPQISEKTAQSVSFGLVIDSMGYRKELKGRIIGFSDRINSILVPEAFLDYGNTQFASPKRSKSVGRVLLVVDDPSSPALLELIHEKNYQTNTEQLRNAELSKILRLITLVVVGIGLLITLLSFIGFIQYSQLAMFKKSYEIQTLLLLGYAPRRIQGVFLRHQLKLIAAIVVLSLAGLWFIQLQSVSWFAKLSYSLEAGLQVAVIPVAIAIFALFLLVQWRTLHVGIRRLTK